MVVKSSTIVVGRGSNAESLTHLVHRKIYLWTRLHGPPRRHGGCAMCTDSACSMSRGFQLILYVFQKCVFYIQCICKTYSTNLNIKVKIRFEINV